MRQALRAATVESHQQVDNLFSHFSLESAQDYRAFLRAHARALGAMEAVARPVSPRLSLLVDDLAALGEPLPDALTIEDARSGEGFRWGLLYALEGSRLGGAMLARRVGADLPRAYLSATHDKGGWIAFQQQMDVAAEQGDEQWEEDAVAGAQAAFALFAAGGRVEREAAHG